MQLPDTVEELMRLLDDLIPEPTPRHTDTREKIMWDAGRRSVVLQLKELRANKVPKVLREKRGEGRVVPRKDT